MSAPQDASAAPAHRSATAPDDDEVLYAWIVWRQFRGNRLAVAGLVTSVLLVVLAIGAPLLCLDLPFWIVYTDAKGASVTAFPWFTSLLFDRNVFESTVDVFFNLLLLASPFAFATALWVRAAARHKRAAERRRMWGRLIGGWAAAVVLALGALSVAQVSQPYTNYAKIYADGTASVEGELAGLRATTQTFSEREVRARAPSAVFPPVPRSFRRAALDRVSAPPSAQHLFGTDSRGRDVFARMVYGTRVSLTIGIVAVSIYITLGVVLGALAGYFRGWVDNVILRLIEVMLCFPSFVLILTLAAFVQKPSIFYVMLIIGLTRWTGPARLTRGEFLRLSNQDFVAAAKATGISQARVIFRHILPNALGPVLVNATFGIAGAILTESALAFLGLGDPSAPSWGELLNLGREAGSMRLILIPGGAIFVTISVFNLVGEGLRDALDPKLRR